MIADLAGIAAELAALIKAQELGKARQRAQEARRTCLATDLTARQQTVHALTLALFEAKKQREMLHQLVEGLPEGQKLFARVQVESICREIFDEQIWSLQAKKRQLSRPTR
jgi:hypothetical protein